MFGGCMLSIVLWLAVASIAMNSVVPLAIGVLFIAVIFLRMGLQSNRPLY